MTMDVYGQLNNPQHADMPNSSAHVSFMRASGLGVRGG
jgi:hypothetical protein